MVKFNSITIFLFFFLHLELFHDNNIYIDYFLRISPSCNQTVKFFVQISLLFKDYFFLQKNIIFFIGTLSPWNTRKASLKLQIMKECVCICIYLATRFQGFKYCTGVLWKIHLPGMREREKRMKFISVGSTSRT